MARRARRTAQLTCLWFGLGLLIWGLAPAVVQRIVSGRTPPLETFAIGSLTCFMGLSFLGLCLLIGRRVVWALWTSLFVSLGLVLSIIGLVLLGGFGVASICPLLLSACTAGASWLALEARKGSGRAPYQR